MKMFQMMPKVAGLCILLSGVMTSCVNRITEEENAATVSDVPFRFVAHVQEATKTRIAGNEFEEGDSVGLFALTENSTMKGERYADNLYFKRSSKGVFESKDLLYFPDEDVNLNLISYYPYQKEGVAIGESVIQVAVHSEQNVSANYFHSDFLVASKENVPKTSEAIALTYKHKFFKLKIAIVPEAGEDVDAILEANPKISVNGFYTQALYDFEKDIFVKYADEESIVPTGRWIEKEGRIVGKELVLIPQETTVGYQCLTLEVGGKTYYSEIPSSLQLQSGKQRELEIAFRAESSHLVSDVTGDIGAWEGNEVDNASSEKSRECIDVSKLTFEQSNVYKALYAGKKVAEICKEYIVTSDLGFQAIVAYPMKDATHSDLSKGLVLQVLGQAGAVHGGSVSWNEETHLFTYTPGRLVARNLIYVLKEGQLSLDKPEQGEVLPVFTCGDMVRDIRRGTIYNYPIVKIGSQYWLRENLKASKYTDGTEVTKLDTMALGATGYVLSKAGNYYYSEKSVLGHQLLPSGCEVPDWKDWNQLKEYLTGDASLMKAGTWLPIKSQSTGKEVMGVNNLSGFNALPVGLCWGAHLPSGYEGKYVSYWTQNETSDAMDKKIFFLRSDTNEIEQGDTSGDKAYAIRCIRK